MLTIAIPFHSDVEYLRRAVQSVFQQTSHEWRLIIRNDNPEEQLTPAQLPELQHPGVEYHHAPQSQGMVANWNACLDLVKTQYVTLLHSDDELAPDYVATMMSLASAYPDAVALFCDARVIGAYGSPKFSFPDFVKRFLIPKRINSQFLLRGEEGLTALLRGNFIFCPTLCYNHSRLGVQRFDSCWSMVQDLEFTTRLLLQGEFLVGTSTKAYQYRRHENNATVHLTRTQTRFDEEHALYLRLAAEAHKRDWNSAEKIARSMDIIKLNIGYCILADLARGDIKAMISKVRKLRDLVFFHGT